MTERIFVDSNILVYAHDLDSGEKHVTAKSWVTKLWESRLGVISAQVLQETYVVLTRKIPHPLGRAEARRVLENFFAWNVVVINPKIIQRAWDIEENCSMSFWDALIVAAAASSGATTLLTEDLKPGQRINGVTIKNPFV